MAPLSLADPTIDNTVGAVFLGLLGACALFGVTSVQAYLYFHNYPDDARLHKVSVVILWYVVLWSGNYCNQFLQASGYVPSSTDDTCDVLVHCKGFWEA